MATWASLKTKKDYKLALNRIDELMDIPRNEKIQNELMLLSYLIEEYEASTSPMPDATPQDVLRFAMEMKGIKPKDLEPILGSKGNVSRVLNGSRKIPLEKIYSLSRLLNIPLESLIPMDKPIKQTSNSS
jgi:HTH-type transcriptional regulator/antitoxin HigA